MTTCKKCGGQFTQSECQKLKSDWTCLACRRAYEKAWRARRKAQGRPVVTAKKSREYYRSFDKQYRQRPLVKDRLNQRARDRRNNPLERPKHLARWKLHHAIEAGKLQRQPCEVCGDRAHAHHDDYSKPLDVRWLCPVHHTEHHANAEKGKAK